MPRDATYRAHASICIKERSKSCTQTATKIGWCSFPMTCVHSARNTTKRCSRSLSTGNGFSPAALRSGQSTRSPSTRRSADFGTRLLLPGRSTIQCLRHTFVVNKMNEWMEAGVDTAVMMPYLSRYLGHSSISGTQYYYHTIEQAFPVVHRHDAVAERVIPEVVNYGE